MKKVVVKNPSEYVIFYLYQKLGVLKCIVSFDATLASALASAEKLFVLVTGEVIPETGKSWCPDCVEGSPVFSFLPSTTRLILSFASS